MTGERLQCESCCLQSCSACPSVVCSPSRPALKRRTRTGQGDFSCNNVSVLLGKNQEHFTLLRKSSSEKTIQKKSQAQRLRFPSGV